MSVEFCDTLSITDLSRRAQGQIEVRGESLHRTRDKLIVTFSANNLSNKAGFFGTSDPFLSISR